MAAHPGTLAARAWAEEKVRLDAATAGYPARDSTTARELPTMPAPMNPMVDSRPKLLISGQLPYAWEAAHPVSLAHGSYYGPANAQHRGRKHPVHFE